MDDGGTTTQGFETWLRARRPALLRAAVAMTRDRDTAEDLLQSALTSLYLAWDDVRDQRALDGYVRRVMANTYASWWRRGWRTRETSTDATPDSSPGGSLATAPSLDLLAAIETRDQVVTLLRALPPKQRTTVVLRYLHERSEVETAELLGVSTGTVKSQTSRALATMRRQACPA